MNMLVLYRNEWGKPGDEANCIHINYSTVIA